MKLSIRFSFTVLMPLALAACGTGINDARVAKPTGDAFNKALYEGYLARAEHEFGYSHYQSSDAFAERAQMAAAGKAVVPFMPNDDAYPSGRVPDSDLDAMLSGRQALLSVFEAGARSKAAKDAATAQVNYDCWIEEQSYRGNFFEDDQPEHAAECRDNFEAALARAQAAVKPAPEPVAAPLSPVPQVPTSYLVFFDWDSAGLTEQARQVVREAAANFGKSNFDRIQVVGHADTSGPANYNSNLSRERAVNVTETLVLQGTRDQSIEFIWKGETEPLVVTGDGIREPQNRRAEIIFQ